MPRLIWSPSARNEVQRLYRFLAPKSVDAARRSIESSRDGVINLGRQPGMRRPAQEMDPEYREWMIDFGDDGFVVLYRHEGSSTVIVAVRHQRDLDY